MRVLLIKTSSLGDLIHTFPALSDAAAAVPGIRFDWLVEEGFREVPAWHPGVERVLTTALRRWRGGWRQAWRRGEIQSAVRDLRRDSYDIVLDAQGLIKSALAARLGRGLRIGYDARSARESLAAWFYQRQIAVARGQHAIVRTRKLFAEALGYALPEGGPDYGLHFPQVHDASQRRLVLLHGTTWPSKHWPEPYWAELTHIAAAEGYEVLLPWGDPDDRLRAERVISAAQAGELLPRSGLTELARLLAASTGVVGVDSGLAHLAAAVGVPAITLYGPTQATLTGALGPAQRNLVAEFDCAPCMRRECDYPGESPVSPACFGRLDPQTVWAALRGQMEAVR